TAMAFSNSADTRGLEQVGLNPATLSLPHFASFEFNLFSLNATLSNNSLNQGIYNQYFTTGNQLTADDKQNLLAAIPTNGLRGDFSTRLNTLAFYVPGFSLSLTATGSGYVNLPREVAQLLLEGNDELGKVYDFSTADAAGWGGLAIQFGVSQEFSLAENKWFDFFAIGATTKYLAGLAYFEIMNTTGHLYNADFNNPNLRFDGQFSARTARGGSGFGLDLGILLHKEKKLSVSMALLNALGSIRWTNQTELLQLKVHSEDLSLNSGNFSDSLIVTEDTSFTIGSFNSRLPLVFDAGVAYRPLKSLLLTAEVEKEFSEPIGDPVGFRTALGMEISWLSFLPLRSGISLGGRDGLSIGFGFGLNLHYWFVDVGVVSHGGFMGNSTRGMTLAVTSRFRF
ncbi:MAG: hypothetical protein D6732_20520, partial [Methanobacteriota archaeon]